MRTARDTNSVVYLFPITNAGIDFLITIFLAYLAYPEVNRFHSMGASVLAAAEDGVLVGSAIALVVLSLVIALFSMDMLVYLSVKIASNEVKFYKLMGKAGKCQDNETILLDAVHIKFVSILYLLPVFYFAYLLAISANRILHYAYVLMVY